MYHKTTQMDPMISSPTSNEYFNSFCHLVGAILSIVGMIVLIVFSAQQEKWLCLISFAIYGITLFLSLLASSLLHFYLLFDQYKRSLGKFDHNAIYLLIAGSYTPFCLVILQGSLGWTLFGIIWGLAILNIIAKSIFFTTMPQWVSLGTYLSMGWLFVFFIYPIYLKMGWPVFIPLGIAGILYSLGSLIFVRDWPDPFPPYFGSHEIWHLSVFLSNGLIYCSMLFYILPYGS